MTANLCCRRDTADLCLTCFCGDYCPQTLTPVQNARFIVSSCPFFPDTVACSLWIAALDHDEDAMARLRGQGHF